MEAKNSLREAMPETAAFVDVMRDTFGAAEINARIKEGMVGTPGRFWAKENGREAGKRGIGGTEVSGKHMVLESIGRPNVKGCK